MKRAVAVIFAILCVGGASAPSSRPARPTPQVELTPLGWLRAYNTAMLNGDKDELLGRSYATGDEARQLADAITAHDALVGKLLKLSKQKLNDKSAHLIGQTLGDISNDDIGNATVTVNGDHAVVTIGGGFGDTKLILRDGQWKLDFDATAAEERRAGTTIDERLAGLKIKTNAAQMLLNSLEAGNVKSVDDALFILRRELSE